MNEMIEALQNVVAAEPEPEVMPVSNQPEAHQPEAEPAREDSDGATETQLTQEIVRCGRPTSTKRNPEDDRKELRQLRAKLAERLYAVKNSLPVPDVGGNGGAAWERAIPRTTADRLVSGMPRPCRLKQKMCPLVPLRKIRIPWSNWSKRCCPG